MRMQTFRDGGRTDSVRHLWIALWGLIERLASLYCVGYSVLLAYRGEWPKAVWFLVMAVLITLDRRQSPTSEP